MKVSYVALPEADKRLVTKRLVNRRKKYTALMSGATLEKPHILLIGDRPGPSAPTDPNYHHTPFYSVKHCSGWLNALLHLEQIDEGRLAWINAFDRHGNPNSGHLITKANPTLIVCLGGNADLWLSKHGANVEAYKRAKVPHPQWHKRFANAEPYQLIDVLRSII